MGVVGVDAVGSNDEPGLNISSSEVSSKLSSYIGKSNSLRSSRASDSPPVKMLVESERPSVAELNDVCFDTKTS